MNYFNFFIKGGLLFLSLMGPILFFVFILWWFLPPTEKEKTIDKKDKIWIIILVLFYLICCLAPLEILVTDYIYIYP